ncbi:MAG: HD domain-containing protein [Rhizobiaceae bacterium]|nr:HD domain-containing protein [Rhizobiaceae bacterium]MCV0405453.1 HD domain-containing protein [Rhizobiaceae bacterium]
MLGVLELARCLLNKIAFSEEERYLIISVAICHDMGHSPFSHSTENVYRKLNPAIDHKAVLEIVLLDNSMGVSKVLTDFNIDVSKVISISIGIDNNLSWIFHNPINIDTLDGMQRFLLSFRLPPPFNARQAVESVASLFLGNRNLSKREVENLDNFWRVKGAFYDQFLQRGKYAEFERAYMSFLTSKKKFIDAGDYLKRDNELAEEIGLLPSLGAEGFSVPSKTDMHQAARFHIDSSVKLHSIADLYVRYGRGKGAK